MTRFWIGAVTLLVLLGLGATTTWLYADTYDPLAADLRQAQDLAMQGDMTAAQKQVTQATNHWQHWRKFAAAVTDHALLEEMDGLFAQLELVSQPLELALLCAKLSAQAEAMSESQKITWWNVL